MTTATAGPYSPIKAECCVLKMEPWPSSSSYTGHPEVRWPRGTFQQVLGSGGLDEARESKWDPGDHLCGPEGAVSGRKMGWRRPAGARVESGPAQHPRSQAGQDKDTELNSQGGEGGRASRRKCPRKREAVTRTGPRSGTRLEKARSFGTGPSPSLFCTRVSSSGVLGWELPRFPPVLRFCHLARKVAWSGHAWSHLAEKSDTRATRAIATAPGGVPGSPAWLVSGEWPERWRDKLAS